MNKIAILLLSAPFILAGCASEKGGDVYSRDQVQQVQHFKVGTVESVHKVRIEGTKSPIGTTAGTIVGGIAGSGASQGKTGQVAAVLGAVVGGVVGAAAEEGYTREDGIEYSIKLEDGELHLRRAGCEQGRRYQGWRQGTRHRKRWRGTRRQILSN